MVNNKKIIAAFIAAALSLSAVSCNNSKKSGSSDEKSSSEAESSQETTDENSDSENSDSSSDESSKAENPLGETVDINDYINTTDIKPAVWKVTDPESGHELYLMGTIHATPLAIKEYPDYILDIYENSDKLAIEYDITPIMEDMSAQIKYLQNFTYTDGTKITDHISEETYNKAKEYLQSIGGYSNFLDLYNPSYWMTTFTSLGFARLENLGGSGTDVFFTEKAKADNKEVVNIETLETQVGATTYDSDELADFILNSYVDNIDNISGLAESYAALYNSWAEGDGEVWEDDVDDDELPDDLADEYDAYIKKAFDDRNKGMAEKAAEFIKEDSSYFFMVGAGHYTGENGVDNLLEKMGFTVEKIN